ncbi:hypothetical protein [Brachyspira hampsonii]|uniref:Uncharacterized protein n=1 Tax=Brachyspira hampsonii 30446 TaxID=1289135 RepID=A0A2U4F9A4_9SPIR|nr:hypothetical protein [Brachyspira hampsonii]EKV55884.1 hypothetical protein A966_13575 [Brachyspira hampsonii 30446]MBW5389547.1 hypothetical protein [Brachyspira hampsonii]MBW5394931.1 hypothetical protein [Brachyspira hampsonii]
MKKFFVGLFIGIALTIFSYNIMPKLYSELSSKDSSALNSIAYELRNIKNILNDIKMELRK